jgi:hypothetical protein
MFIHHLSRSKPQALKKLEFIDSGIPRKSKWIIKRRIVVVGIPTVLLNSTKSLIILP